MVSHGGCAETPERRLRPPVRCRALAYKEPSGGENERARAHRGRRDCAGVVRLPQPPEQSSVAIAEMVLASEPGTSTRNGCGVSSKECVAPMMRALRSVGPNSRTGGFARSDRVVGSETTAHAYLLDTTVDPKPPCFCLTVTRAAHDALMICKVIRVSWAAPAREIARRAIDHGAKLTQSLGS